MDDDLGSHVIMLEIRKISPIHPCRADCGRRFSGGVHRRIARKIKSRVLMAVIDRIRILRDLGNYENFSDISISRGLRTFPFIGESLFAISLGTIVSRRTDTQYRNLIKTDREREREREREKGDINEMTNKGHNFTSALRYSSFLTFRSLLLCRSIFPLTQ